MRLTLKEPKASLLPQMATDWWAMLPKHILEKQKDMRTTVMGTGPLLFKNYTRGISYEVVKNPNYWVPDRPYLDGIKWFLIADPATSLAALTTGRVHSRGFGGPGVTPTEGRTIRKNYPQIVVVEFPAYTWDVLYMNNGRAPFSDPRVRRAIDLALDRDNFIKVGAEEAGVTGYFASPPPPAGAWGFSIEEMATRPGWRKPKDQDIAEAKRLLAEAGFPNGFKTALSYRAAGAAYDRRAVILKDQLASIGVDASIRSLESATVFDFMGRHDFDLLNFRDAATMDDPDEFLALYYHSKSAKNWGQFKDDKVDQLLEEQSRTVDVAARKKLVQDAQLRMLELSLAAHLNWVVYWAAWWPNVRGVVSRSLYAYNRLDYVWLAE